MKILFYKEKLEEKSSVKWEDQVIFIYFMIVRLINPNNVIETVWHMDGPV